MKSARTTRSTLALALAAGLVSGAAQAAPLIIDDNCAQAGCFPGDRPGLPIEIEQPGSYRLASNLEMTRRDPYGIVIVAPNVHLDMEGFAILGENRCQWTGETAECEQPNRGSAILVLDEAESVSIVNGSIHGIAGNGILIRGTGARIEDIMVREVSTDGIAIGGGGGLVADCIVDRAGRIGFFAPTIGEATLFSRVVVSRSTAAFNAGALDNVVARNNGRDIGSLNVIIDGSLDGYSSATP
jgi:hypothetical protein